MPYVSVKLSDGLGNRLFQVAAMLGYAEKYKYAPVFVKEWSMANSHPGSHTIYDYFPHIPVVDTAEGAWKVVTLPGDAVFSYIELPPLEGNVKLEGYFQSQCYFPANLCLPQLLDGVVKPVDALPPRCAFLHVRRGDYLSPYTAHHNVNLGTYYRRAIGLYDPDVYIFVCSDDMDWCMSELPRRYSDLVLPHRWIFAPSTLSDTETLALMAQCAMGGICANSTFSWWGAYFSFVNARSSTEKSRGLWTMPGTWGYAPLPPARDLYPPWATVLPV